MSDLTSIYALLEQALADVQKGNAVVNTFSPALKLGGKEGALDSLDTMLFLDRVEELLEEREGKPVKLVTDDAFLRENNPFQTMEALAAYITDLTTPPEPE